MATESDKVYKDRINKLNASIQSDRERLNKMDRMFSGYSQEEIEATRKSIRNKQSQLQDAQRDYDAYTKAKSSGLTKDQAVFFADSEVTKGTYDYSTGTYTKTSDSSSSSTASSNKASTAKSADDASNSIVSTVTGAVDSAASGISSMANSAANTVNGVVNNATNFVSNLANTAEQAISKATAGLSNAVTGIKNGISKLFSSDDSSEKKALTAKQSDKGPAETDTKVKTLEANSNEAVSQPVAFTSAETKVVTTPTKSAETDTKSDTLSGFGKLASAAKSIGSKIGQTFSTVTSAVKGVTSNLKKAINTAKAAVNSVKKAVMEPIVSTVKAVNETITDAVNGVREFTKPIVEGYQEVIDGTKGFVNDIADALPGSLGEKLRTKANSFIQEKIEDKVNSKLAAFNDVLDKVQGLGLKGDVGDIFNRLLHSESSSSYAHDLVSFDGSPAYDSYGDNAAGTITGLYTAASSVCPGVTVPDISDKSINSRIYNMLLLLAAENNVADLINQMGACGKSTGYFNESSLATLKQSLPDIAMSGNVSTYTSVFNLVGSSNVPDPDDNLRTLIANNGDANASTVASYNWLAQQSGHKDASYLLMSDTGIEGIKAYNMNSVGFMTCGNTVAVDSYIGKDNRTLVQAMCVHH